MQECNAGERKDRIRVYPSVVLRFYKRRREGDATQRIILRRIVNRPLGSDAIMACCVKVCVCLVQGGEISAKKVWRFDGNEIDSYCVEGVERELLELFPKVKSSGLRLDLTYEDELSSNKHHPL